MTAWERRAAIRRVFFAALALLSAAGCATVVPGPPAADLADGRTGRIAFGTMTTTARQFLLGENGTPTVTALQATMTRYQQNYLTPGFEFAAYLPFYAFCNTRIIDDVCRVVSRPRTSVA